MSQFDNTPLQNPDVSAPPQLSGNEQVMAILSIVFGTVGLCAGFLLGICGTPFPILGLLLGYLALKDPAQKTLAFIGMAVSILGLVMICAIVLFVGAVTLLGPAIGNVFSGVNQSLTP